MGLVSKMEVSYSPTPLPQDMDLDLDIDLGPVEEPEDVHSTADQTLIKQPAVESKGIRSQQISSAKSDGITPHRIYILGVDDLATNDLKRYATENFDLEVPQIQWIDDSSAILVYSTADVAANALKHLVLPSSGFSDSSQLPIFQLRAAKHLSSHQDSRLQIRIALSTDKKRPRAYESSRFYLMHPQHDPREQRRRGSGHHSSNGDYRRRIYDHDEDRRRRHHDRDAGFDASMYDDNHVTSRRASLGSSSEERRRLVDSYRPRRLDADGTLRDRSASPGDYTVNQIRNRTPPPSYRSRDPHPFPKENRGKELFPSRDYKAKGKDLVSNKMAAAKTKKELFPLKANLVSHRRSDAFDAADETADLFANGLSVPFTDAPRSSVIAHSHKINGASESSYGRLKIFDPPPEAEVQVQEDFDDNDLNIRGAAQQDQGFSIRGTGHVGTIRELFPGKANAGKELLAEKLKGRGGKRNKAEDMFY